MDDNNQIQKFDPSKLMDGVRDRIKATFVSLIPDDAWDRMVEKEIYIFTQGRINVNHETDWKTTTPDGGHPIISTETRIPYSQKPIKDQWNRDTGKDDISPLQEMIREELRKKFRDDLQIFMSDKELSPEDKLMTAIFGKPISEMSEEEKQAILDEEYDKEADSVSDEEFEKTWGISINDHTKKMMCFVHWANAVNHFLIQNKCVKDSYHLHDLIRIAKFFYDLGRSDPKGRKLEYIKHPADFKSEDETEVPEKAQINFYDLVTSKWKEGKVVWMSEEGPLVMDFDKWVKQPLAGMLYDLNRDLAVVLTFINDPKWVNDYATVRLLEYFYNKYQNSRVEIEVLEKQIENLNPKQ